MNKSSTPESFTTEHQERLNAISDNEAINEQANKQLQNLAKSLEILGISKYDLNFINLGIRYSVVK
jgi:hypothetical protein